MPIPFKFNYGKIYARVRKGVPNSSHQVLHTQQYLSFFKKEK